MNRQDEDFNPFQAPEVPYSEGNPGDSSVEAIRREYLSHEASVQSIGLLYYLGGFLILVASLWLLFTPTNGPAPTEMTLLVVLLPVLAIAQLFTAYGLRKLKSWARISTGFISGIGLIGFPTGTLINAYILYLVFSAKGRMVFSEEYREVIVACPSSQYHGYESQFGLRVTAGVGQFSASGAHAKEAENCRANSTGVWSPSELCGRR